MQRSGALPGSEDAASERVQLARLALHAALAVPNVIRGEAGPRVSRVTADTSGVLIGMTATAQADGRYAIDLRLVTRLVPLLPLADEVRSQVRRAVSRVGLAVLLGEVNVEFSDLLTSPPTGGKTARESSGTAVPESAAGESVAATGEPPPTLPAGGPR